MGGIKHTIDIRVLEADDADAYKAMRLEAASDPSFGIEPETEAAYSVGLLRQALMQDDGSYVLGAFDRQQMIGMVGFGRGMTAGTGTLFGLFVAPGHRRRRVAEQLCLTLFERHPGIAIRLEVLRENLPAVCLYSGLGFLEAEQSFEHPFENSAQTLVMIRPPASA